MNKYTSDCLTIQNCWWTLECSNKTKIQSIRQVHCVVDKIYKKEYDIIYTVKIEGVNHPNGGRETRVRGGGDLIWKSCVKNPTPV